MIILANRMKAQVLEMPKPVTQIYKDFSAKTLLAGGKAFRGVSKTCSVHEAKGMGCRV